MYRRTLRPWLRKQSTVHLSIRLAHYCIVPRESDFNNSTSFNNSSTHFTFLSLPARHIPSLFSSPSRSVVRQQRPHQISRPFISIPKTESRFTPGSILPHLALSNTRDHSNEDLRDWPSSSTPHDSFTWWAQPAARRCRSATRTATVKLSSALA